MNTQRFGEFLKARRRAKKYTRERLAAELAISASHLNNIERGNRLPSPELIIELAHKLGVRSGDLFQLLDEGSGGAGELLSLPAHFTVEEVQRVRDGVNRLIMEKYREWLSLPRPRPANPDLPVALEQARREVYEREDRLRATLPELDEGLVEAVIKVAQAELEGWRGEPAVGAGAAEAITELENYITQLQLLAQAMGELRGQEQRSGSKESGVRTGESLSSLIQDKGLRVWFNIDNLNSLSPATSRAIAAIIRAEIEDQQQLPID